MPARDEAHASAELYPLRLPYSRASRLRTCALLRYRSPPHSIESTTFAKCKDIKGFGHAVVIGAGAGGLLAGRVLADYFQWVTLVERDLFTFFVSDNNDPTSRKGVPQCTHLHSLATRGGETLEQYFPALTPSWPPPGAPP